MLAHPCHEPGFARRAGLRLRASLWLNTLTFDNKEHVVDNLGIDDDGGRSWLVPKPICCRGPLTC